MTKHSIVRKNGGELEVFDPFRDARSLRRTFSELFEDLLPLSGLKALPGAQGWQPPIDIAESEKELVVAVELPGVKKDDIRVQYRDHAMTVRAERKEQRLEKGRELVRREQYFGSISRTFTLPENARGEHARCSYKDGVLTIRIPRRGEPSAPGKDIPVE